MSQIEGNSSSHQVYFRLGPREDPMLEVMSRQLISAVAQGEPDCSVILSLCLAVPPTFDVLHQLLEILKSSPP